MTARDRCAEPINPCATGAVQTCRFRHYIVAQGSMLGSGAVQTIKIRSRLTVAKAWHEAKSKWLSCLSALQGRVNPPTTSSQSAGNRIRA